MRGDKVLPESFHYRAADSIVAAVADAIHARPSRYVISISGESGSGKSETAQALRERMALQGITSVILGQDDYFVLPPRKNDEARRRDSTWLGPAVEVRLDLLDAHCLAAVQGARFLVKPLIDYATDSIEEERVSLEGVMLVIAEGTYTALLRHVHTRVFIARTRLETLEHRSKRARGSEASDPFVEGILEIEHKIIAGHRSLADFIITRDYDVIHADARNHAAS